MKKKISLILLVVTLLSCFYQVSAEKNGDVVNKALFTDIVAYINHYPIQSFNVDGYTTVVAEDLANYGFNVEWNEAERSLRVTSNDKAKEITPYGSVYKIPDYLVGIKAQNVLYTDIKTYINGQEVKSYNIGGKTIIYFEDLKPYGEVVWVPEIRAIKMWIEKLSITKYDPPQIMDSNVLSMFSGYWSTIDKNLFSYNCELTNELYNETESKYATGHKYKYKIVSAMKDNPLYVDSIGSGYYLDIRLFYNRADKKNQVLSSILLYIETDNTDTLYKREQVCDVIDTNDYIKAKAGKFVNLDKQANPFQVGDTVTMSGYVDTFVGTVKQISGNKVLVYWYDLVDVAFGQSVWKNYSDSELGMSELISGAKLFKSTWHDKNTLHK